MFTWITKTISHSFSASLNSFIPLGHLAIRCWLASIFLPAGLLKSESWISTVYLFSYEYHVPFLEPEVAAFLSTFIELSWPILLILGLGGRFMYVVFFLYNLIAMISYPYLWTQSGYVGLQQHINWGLLIMMLMFYGSGKLSLDYYLKAKFSEFKKSRKIVLKLKRQPGGLAEEPAAIRVSEAESGFSSTLRSQDKNRPAA